MKTLNIILAVLFFGFAALQFNDDPDDVWFWVLMYGLVGTISAFAAFGKYNMWIIILGFGAAVYQMFRIGPAFLQWIYSGMPSIVGEMKATSPHIELVREFLGLVVCMIVLIFHYVRYTKLKREPESPEL